MCTRRDVHGECEPARNAEWFSATEAILTALKDAGYVVVKVDDEATVLTAARGLHEHELGDPWDDEGCNDTGEGSFTYTSCKQDYIARARAALAALGEPEAKETDDA